MNLNAVDVDRIRNIALVIYFIYFILFNLNRIKFLIATTMADTAGPQTPSRKLFKAASKTKTPPVRKQHSISVTPRSAEPASAKSSSPSPGLFRKPSGATPKLVRKASSHVQSTPSKPAPEDIIKSTPLAPLSTGTKIFVAKRRKADSVASDTTGNTPIGLIDNDVLTPTDMGASHDDPNAPDLDPETLSKESSMVMTGAAGGLPDHDSTIPGSPGVQQFETATDATRSPSKRATDPLIEDARQVPKQTTGAGDHDVESKNTRRKEENEGEKFTEETSPQDSTSRQHESQQHSTTSSVDERDMPSDLAQYFTNQGNHEMSEFVKALLAPSEDPTSTVISALGLTHESGQAAADKVRDDAEHQPPITETQNQKQSRTATSEAVPETLSNPQDSIHGFPEVSSHPFDELPTNDELIISDPVNSQSQDKTIIPRDADEKSGHGISGFPDVSTNAVEELPNNDDLVVEPTSRAKDTLPKGSNNHTIPLRQPATSTDKTRDTTSGFSDGSSKPIDALPAPHENPTAAAVVGATNTAPANIKVSGATEALPAAAIAPTAPTTAAPATGQATGDKVARDASQTRKLAEVAASPNTTTTDTTTITASAADSRHDNKIGLPDIEGIVKGGDITASDHIGKPLDLSGSISSRPQDLQSEGEDLHQAARRESTTEDKAGVPSSSHYLNDGAIISEATQNPAVLRDQVAPLREDARDTADSLPSKSTKTAPTANGFAQAAMAGAQEDLAAKAPQQPSASDATGHATSNEAAGGIQAQADNMGKPAHINRRIDIPLPRPERPSSSSKSGLHMPEVDNLRSTEGLPNVNDLDDPPEEFLDPSVHSPQQPSANISPIPKIQKVNPIDSQPPPDLARLANGLGGHSIDDVGNIVDNSGKVLGHATGDLPSMIGKKVADNGEVYGDSGELIGYVTENFTGHPPPTASETNKSSASRDTPLPGGLRVDLEGNILDASGNVIGKMHSKPGQPTNALAPYNGKEESAPRNETNGEQGQSDNEKPRAKFDEGGIPADIFLDVKSTPDGIQLTIRIPTIFKQETRQTAEASSSSA
ncbi:hypothetical protein PFICI_15228 [Pestalotiopsis fici W106-1]|uniref:Uncharacterized protein n=1 Tax=Pestalotiopsis fici (strain W106-1 / CGMCC3.15140) TaxID=1229662 RepID=W3WGM0_PESFW|nr:uncharacterized protein PFICI_15228 [Pestalotiopsis fici W106-1]ETS73053.1 hypothetical protein PFICI_15228 [Pestalotiopsis fici W106-1]